MPTLSFTFCTAATLFAAAMLTQPSDTRTTFGERISKFAPVDLTADASGLSINDTKALAKIVEAAKLMNSIYIRQVWSGNAALQKQLEADTSPEGMEKLHLFRIYQSPFSALDHYTAWLDGVPPRRPEGANYYPPDVTKDEFNAWVATLPEAEKKKATGFFTTIRRDANGKLLTVPYSEEYREFLEPAAALLRDAATLTDNATLKTFLSKRADAFLSNDYYASDVAWMDLDSPIDVTIGPYETYMDELFGYKAAFEAYVTLRNNAESQKLDRFGSYLQDVENHLPIDPKYRNPKLGASAPIRVVDVVAIGGEAQSGVQTAAYNLPNDEQVIKEKGSKRVMLKNIQQAKFEKVLRPIAAIALGEDQRGKIAFDPFFTHILAHELMHGLGPHSITVNGKSTTVRLEFKELYSAIEEAKADISGLWMLQYLIDKGELDRSIEQQMYITFLAGVFRSVRFGVAEAHGKGMALQFNYLLDKGAFTYDDATGTFSVNLARIKEATRDLTGRILTMQAEGNYAGAKKMLDTYGVIRPAMKAVLDRLTDIPVDIEPRFSMAQ